MSNPLYPNLKFEMARNGDTQLSLAEKMGLNSAIISRRLNGESNFKLPEIKKILNLYNVTFEYLFDFNPQPKA